MKNLLLALIQLLHGLFFAPTELKALQQQWILKKPLTLPILSLHGWIVQLRRWFPQKTLLLIVLGTLPFFVYCLLNEIVLAWWGGVFFGAWVISYRSPQLGFMLPLIGVIYATWSQPPAASDHLMNGTQIIAILIGGIFIGFAVYGVFIIKSQLQRRILGILPFLVMSFIGVRFIDLRITIPLLCGLTIGAGVLRYLTNQLRTKATPSIRWIMDVFSYLSLTLLICVILHLVSLPILYVELDPLMVSKTTSFIIRIFFFIAGLAAFIFMLLGAFAWITSGGDREAIDDARQRIQAAVVSLIMMVVVLTILWTLEVVVFERKVSIGLSTPFTIPGLFESTNSESLVIPVAGTPLLISGILLVYTLSSVWRGGVVIGLTIGIGILMGMGYNIGIALISVVLLLLVGFRIITDYLWSIVMILETYRQRYVIDDRMLQLLPPSSSEILWIPLPRYNWVLNNVLDQHPERGLATIRTMQQSIFWGIRQTLHWALPGIVIHQFTKADSLRTIIMTTRPTHPILSTLIPTIYDHVVSTDMAGVIDYSRRLLLIARDIEQALAADQAFLRLDLLKQVQTAITLFEKYQFSRAPRSRTHIWQTVAPIWYRLVQTEIDRIEQVVGHGIIQPFQYGKPISSARSHLFKGRTQFAETIVRHVLNQGTGALVLYGPRRCGKTSFLLNLPHLLPHSITPVYVDLQRGGMVRSEIDWCFGLTLAIADALNLAHIDASLEPRIDLFSSTNPYRSLETWLKSIKSHRGGQHLLICFDEIEKLSHAIVVKQLSTDILDQLRSFIQHGEALTFLFCGARTLDELGPSWTDHFINARPMEMTYLLPDEARSILIDPDPTFHLVYDEGVIETILVLTSGHPFLIQLIGYELVSLANTHGTRHITSNLVETAVEAALTAGEIYFSELWLHTVGQYPEDQVKVQNILWALAIDEPIPEMNDPSTVRLLRQLQRHHLIHSNQQHYQIEVPLVKRWIRERAIHSVAI